MVGNPVPLKFLTGLVFRLPRDATRSCKRCGAGRPMSRNRRSRRLRSHGPRRTTGPHPRCPHERELPGWSAELRRGAPSGILHLGAHRHRLEIVVVQRSVDRSDVIAFLRQGDHRRVPEPVAPQPGPGSSRPGAPGRSTRPAPHRDRRDAAAQNPPARWYRGSPCTIPGRSATRSFRSLPARTIGCCDARPMSFTPSRQHPSTRAGAVRKRRHETGRAVQPAGNRGDVLAAEDDREPAGSPRAHDTAQPRKVLAQHLAVEEQQRLRRLAQPHESVDVAPGRQRGEERANVGAFPRPWRAPAVKANEPWNPCGAGPLHSATIASGPGCPVHRIQHARWAGVLPGWPGHRQGATPVARLVMDSIVAATLP